MKPTLAALLVLARHLALPVAFIVAGCLFIYSVDGLVETRENMAREDNKARVPVATLEATADNERIQIYRHDTGDGVTCWVVARSSGGVSISCLSIMSLQAGTTK